MVTVSKPVQGTLHRWSGRAFLLGGGLLVVAMVIDGVVPGVAVLIGLDLLLGAIAVYLLSRASSSDVK